MNVPSAGAEVDVDLRRRLLEPVELDEVLGERSR